MSEDRKRLIISIGAAVLLHLVILILTGMNRPDYETAEAFGPITVEISLDKPTESRPPEPEDEQIAQLDIEEAPPADTIDEPLPAAEPEPAPVPVPAVTPPAEASPRSYAPPAADDSFLEALKQRSSTGGIDARAVFGDDPVPSTTDRPDAPSAAGARDDSEVLLSDSSPVTDRTDSPPPEEPSEMSVIEAGDLSSLDRLLSTGAASNAEPTSSGNTSSELTRPSAEVSGQSRSLKFDDPSLSRRLLDWKPPEIPADVQTAGIAKYTVVIEFDIDSDGLVSNFHFVSRSADSRVDAAVQTALYKWLFEESSPASNKKVRATLTYVIEIK